MWSCRAALVVQAVGLRAQTQFRKRVNLERLNRSLANWVDDYVDEQFFAGAPCIEELDRLIYRGEVPPVIVASPDGTDSGENQRRQPHSLFINGCGGRFEDHILLEVPPFIDAALRGPPTARGPRPARGLGRQLRRDRPGAQAAQTSLARSPRSPPRSPPLRKRLEMETGEWRMSQPGPTRPVRATRGFSRVRASSA